MITPTSPPWPNTPHWATPFCHPARSNCCCNAPMEAHRRAKTAWSCDTFCPVIWWLYPSLLYQTGHEKKKRDVSTETVSNNRLPHYRTGGDAHSQRWSDTTHGMIHGTTSNQQPMTNQYTVISSQQYVPQGPASSHDRMGRSHRTVQNRRLARRSRDSSNNRSRKARTVPSASWDADSELRSRLAPEEGTLGTVASR